MSGSSTQSGGSGSAGAQSNLTSSPSSTTSTLSAVSADTLRPRRTSPSRSPSPSPSAPPGRKASQKDSPSRPSLLCPPATVISPPSPRPLAATQLSLPPQSMSPASSASSLPGTPDAGPSHPQPNLGRRDSLAVPIPALSPGRTPGSEGETFFSASPFSSPGLPMPSSPQAYPKTPGHRRHSSTHRVKETPNGHQRSTEDGETMINEYKIGKPLGKGGFAKVELAVHVGTGEEYAIKEFSQSRLRTQSLLEKRRVTMNRKLRGRGRGRGGTPSGGRPIPARRCSMSGSDGKRASSEPDANDPLGLIRREIAVMKKLDHPNIVKLTEAISVPNADALYLVLEYMPGGVLMHIKMGEEAGEPPFGIEQAREYFRQLILGLEYLHGNGVVHRDIKPDNILLSRDHTTVKLCDFGVSEMFEVADSDDRIKRSGGSPAFLSPESFTSHAHEVHGKLVDIWALGVTLYCMFTGVLPFNTENPIELFDKVRHEEPTIPDEWPGDQQDLIRQMLRKEPSFRIHMFLLREHPWVTEDGANPMISREDNMTHVGKIVEEPTEQEISAAIRVKGAFTVIRAVQKLKRMAGISTSPKPSPPIRNSTLDSITSGTRTGTTGSMDSYVSEMPTEDTSMEDEEQRG
ncbi:kinase-like domain-containing protein, partial [Dioszegia hungarica]